MWQIKPAEPTLTQNYPPMLILIPLGNMQVNSISVLLQPKWDKDRVEIIINKKTNKTKCGTK